MSGTCTIVIGPQGCGKTENAEAIRRAYGCVRIVDDWDGDSVSIRPGSLLLANTEHRFKRIFAFPVRVVTYKVAMEMVKIDMENAGIRN